MCNKMEAQASILHLYIFILRNVYKQPGGSMNRGLKNEVSFLLAASGVLSLFMGRKKTGLVLTSAAAGLVLSNFYETKESLFDKNIIITGGSRGLGFALAQEAVRQGANVILLARTKEELEKAQLMLRQSNEYSRVEVFVCDVTDKNQLHAIIDAIIIKFKTIDIVINNAGQIIVGPFESMSESDFRKQMDLHMFAVLNMTQILYPHFKENKKGHIVNICSIGGRVAVPHMLPYDASKFALSGLSQGLAAELQKDNITVTTVYPSLMKTGSPIQAQFKGNQKNEFTWFATSDYMPGISMPADMAAKKIIQGIKEKRTEIIFSTIGKARLYGSLLFPELMRWTMSILNSLMPTNTSRVPKLGQDLKPQAKLFNTLFGQESEITEKKYNQLH